MSEKFTLEKIAVCDSCFSIGHPNYDCVCTYQNYTTIVLEFKRCSCCGQLSDEPANTAFNEAQYTKIVDDRDTHY